MKKLFLITLLSLPSALFAQEAASNSWSLEGFLPLLVIPILIGLFLIFRSVTLWYFKIDTIVKNQEILNDIARQQNKKMNELIEVLKEKVN